MFLAVFHLLTCLANPAMLIERPGYPGFRTPSPCVANIFASYYGNLDPAEVAVVPYFHVRPRHREKAQSNRVEFLGYIRPPVSGVYHFRVKTNGLVRLWVRSRLLVDIWYGRYEDFVRNEVPSKQSQIGTAEATIEVHRHLKFDDTWYLS